MRPFDPRRMQLDWLVHPSNRLHSGCLCSELGVFEAGYIVPHTCTQRFVSRMIRRKGVRLSTLFSLFTTMKISIRLVSIYRMDSKKRYELRARYASLPSWFERGSIPIMDLHVPYENISRTLWLESKKERWWGDLTCDGIDGHTTHSSICMMSG